MYNNIYSSVRFKNWLTPQIQLQQGVWQGCPLSCHLFNLVGQVLVFHLRDHGFFDWWKQHGDPCSLYADNTTIFIESLSQLATLIVEIQCVGHFTGLHLNLNKMIVLSLHDKPQKISGVQVDNKPMKYLGTHLGTGDLSDINFSVPLQKAWNSIQNWNKRHLILMGKVLVAKTFIASLFVHVMNTTFLQTQQLQFIQQLLSDFIWQGCAKVKNSVCCARYWFK